MAINCYLSEVGVVSDFFLNHNNLVSLRIILIFSCVLWWFLIVRCISFINAANMIRRSLRDIYPYMRLMALFWYLIPIVFPITGQSLLHPKVLIHQDFIDACIAQLAARIHHHLNTLCFHFSTTSYDSTVHICLASDHPEHLISSLDLLKRRPLIILRWLQVLTMRLPDHLSAPITTSITLQLFLLLL
jgi:hypothetical protein